MILINKFLLETAGRPDVKSPPPPQMVKKVSYCSAAKSSRHDIIIVTSSTSSTSSLRLSIISVYDFELGPDFDVNALLMICVYLSISDYLEWRRNSCKLISLKKPSRAKSQKIWNDSVTFPSKTIYRGMIGGSVCKPVSPPVGGRHSFLLHPPC